MKLHCSGGAEFYGRRFGCWVKSGHGEVDLTKAIYQSCDVFFYQAGIRAGIDQLAKTAKEFGLGEESGFREGREVPGAPHQTLLVLDATTGQNAVNQAKMFNESIGVTGLVLTKLDGTAKGGIIIRLAKEFDIPIRYIGIGEKMDDLRPFDSAEFVDALME